MNWEKLISIEELDKWDDSSKTKPVLFFKHSTRCMTSKMVLGRVERNWNEKYSDIFVPVFLDLIRYRDVSNAIVTKYNINHESPQAILVKDGKCIWNASHTEINLETINALDLQEI